jgi:hypothetical protein
MQAGADVVGIVALVGEKIGGTLLGQGDYLFECRAVRRFARREMEDERDASRITETMNFTGEPAPRTAESLFHESPLLHRKPRHDREPSSNPGCGGSCGPSPGQESWRPLPRCRLRPSSEALIDRHSFTVRLRQIAPRRAVRMRHKMRCH